MSNALEIKNLCKSYPGFTLNNVSFSLPTGYILGFVGQNGAGKTTTIRLILNMAQKTSGEIKVFGLDNIQDEQAIKQDVAVVFDNTHFVDNWTVREVEQALRIFYANWSSDSYHDYVSKFHLSLKKKVKELSRGMKMKLMLAVAMSHDAKLLIMDEPTSGLDPVARDELLGILSSYISDGSRSILFSTHITSDLEKIADYITLIDNGKIFYSGTRDDLFESFLIVKGGLNELQDPLRDKIIGLSMNHLGFSGLIRSIDRLFVPDEIVMEPPSIDEILVAISREEGTHE